MSELNVIIEKNEDAFFAYVEEIEGCVAGGNSYSEVKENITEIIQIMFESDEELALKYVDGYELVFEVNLESVFSLLPEVNVSQLAKLGGLNSGLLRQYVSGSKKASEKQAEKVMQAFKMLSNKLNSIQISS